MKMKLESAAFEAEFCPELGNFTHLVNRLTGDDYIKTSPRFALTALYGVDKATRLRREIPLGPCTLTGDAGCLQASYPSIECGGSLLLTLLATEQGIVVSAVVENQSDGVEITELLCPHLGGIYLGESYQDDYIIYPHHGGERTRNPIEEYAGERMQGFWRANSREVDGMLRREINYCGLASMSWMYYHDAENGLYIGSHDPRFPVTGLIAECCPSDPQMGFGFRKYHRICKGERYSSGDYLLAVSDKDWHYGAQLYRDYLLPHISFDNTPDFLTDECALNQCYNFKRTGSIENRFSDIPKLFETGKAWGVRHIFIAGWNRTGFDSFYPEYYPDMELGSAMEFRRGLEYVREQGGFSTLYINARIFDLKSDFHKTVGERMALRNHQGEMLYETYGPERFTVNCPSDTLWRDYLLDTAEFAMKAYGCDGIYLDQLASAEPFACYCREHSHAQIEDFNNGYLYLLKELLGRLRKHNPNAYLMTENCGDIYGSYTWGNLTWNGADYDEYYNIFRYAFPELVQVNMVNPRGWVDDPAQKYDWFFRDMHRAILLGSVLWMGITTRMRPQDGEYHSASKEFLAFRKRLQPLLKGAAYQDDAWLTGVEGGECHASCWVLADGRRMLLCANSSIAEAGELQLELPEAVRRMWLYQLDWQETVTEPHRRDLKIPLLPKQLCCAILAPYTNST